MKRYSEKFLKNSWVQAAFFKIKHHLFEQQLIFGKSNGCSNDLTVFTSSVDHMTSLIHCKDSSWLDVRTAETTHQSIKYLPHQAQLLP